MGTKRGYLVLVGLMLLLLFSGCGEKAAPVEKGAGGLEDVLVAPLPTEGVKVAEIGGYDYVYDPLYLFQVEAADWSDMSAAQIKRCLLLELTAREAAETMAITEESVTPIPGTDDTRLALEDYRKNGGASEEPLLKLYDETIPLILERDGIDEDTFWQRLPEYAAKRELSDDYILALQETYEEQHGTGDEAGFLKYLDNHYNDLLEKYQVKQVY